MLRILGAGEFVAKRTLHKGRVDLLRPAPMRGLSQLPGAGERGVCRAKPVAKSSFFDPTPHVLVYRLLDDPALCPFPELKYSRDVAYSSVRALVSFTGLGTAGFLDDP